MVDAIYPAQDLTLNSLTVATQIEVVDLLVSNDADINNLSENMTVTAGMTIDGQDISTLTPDGKEFEWSGGTGSNALQNNGTNEYCLPNSGYNPSDDEGENIMPVGRNCRITEARFYLSTAPDNGGGVQKYVFTLRKGAPGSMADTTVTEEIEEAEREITVTGLTEDITAGQYVTLNIVSSGTPTQEKASWSFKGVYT